MARIAEGLFDQVWAETPGSADDVITPTDARQVAGWGNSFFQPGGDLPQGEHMNALFNRQTAFSVDVQRHGVLEWDANQNYEHPAACFGGDDLYVSLANSGPDHGGAVDPTGLVGTTRWRLAGSSNQFVPAPQVAGTADAIELSPTPAILVYTVGLTLIFQAEGDSTAGVTVAVSGLAATNLHFTDGQAGSGDIVTGRFYTIRYDGSNFVVVSGAEYAVRPISAGGTGGRTAAQARTNLGVAREAAGVPDGGTADQVLAKASGTDYDTEWQTITIPPAGIQTLTEGDHIDITGTGTTRAIAVTTGTVSGRLAVLGTAGRFAVARIPELQDLDGTLDVASGGTGATDAAGARTNLGISAENFRRVLQSADQDISADGTTRQLTVNSFGDTDYRWIQAIVRLRNGGRVSGFIPAVDVVDQDYPRTVVLDTYGAYAINTTAGALYTVDVADGTASRVHATNTLTPANASQAAFLLNGRAYCMVSTVLYEIDLTAGTVTRVHATNVLPRAFQAAFVMNGVAYGIWTNVLYEINAADGTAVLVHASNTLANSNNTSAFSVGGRAYSIDLTTRVLYEVNVAEGTSARVHAANALLASGAAIEASFATNGTAYLINQNDDALYEIDLTDGTASLVHASNTLPAGAWEAAFSGEGTVSVDSPVEGIDLNGARLALWRETADPNIRLRAALDDSDDDVTIEQIIGVA